MFSGPVELGQHCFSGQIRDAHPDFLPGGPSVCRNKPVGPPGKKSGWTSRIWRLKQCWPSSGKPLSRMRFPNCGRMWSFQLPHLVLMQGWFDELLLCSMWSFNRWRLYCVRAKSFADGHCTSKCLWLLFLLISWPDDALPLRFACFPSIRWQDYLKKVLASRYLRSFFEEQRPLFSRVSLSKTLALSSWFVGIASVVRHHTHVRPSRRKTNQSQCDAEEIDIYLQQCCLAVAMQDGTRLRNRDAFRTLAFAGHQMGQAGWRAALRSLQCNSSAQLPQFTHVQPLKVGWL